MSIHIMNSEFLCKRRKMLCKISFFQEKSTNLQINISFWTKTLVRGANENVNKTKDRIPQSSASNIILK